MSAKLAARWIPAVILGVSLSLLAPVSEALEMIEVERVGSKRITGTLLGVKAAGNKLILVKVSVDGHERDFTIEQLEPAGRDRVLMVMAQVARLNGVKMPALKFTASKKSESKMDRTRGGSSVKSTSTTHQLSVLNSGPVATGPILLYQFSRSVTTRRSDNAPSSKEVSWDLDEEKIDALQPGQRQDVPFVWLDDVSQKTVESRTSTVKVSGKNVSVVEASRQSEQTNIEVVYLMAFDQTTGMLVYFVKM